MSPICFGGLDFGSSGARISVINTEKEIIYSNTSKYRYQFSNPESWRISCQELLSEIPAPLKKDLCKISISGTSGTLLACNKNGNFLGKAIPYYQRCYEDKKTLEFLSKDNAFLNNPYSSLAKALELIRIYGEDILLRHQADWISGWLIGNWSFGEEGNNIKLGWDIESGSWPDSYISLPWNKCLPNISKSGEILGRIKDFLANKLELNKRLLIVAGTTDSNAAYLSSQIMKEEGLTVLGTTMVLKKGIDKPVKEPGITIHRVNEEWICGGASNAGCGILSKFFSDSQIKELSRQINTSKSTNLNLLPLNSIGERFPINDPLLKPVLEPRPVSDALYLQALFEGLASIELKGWERIKDLTGSLPKKIITIGGGAKNPQWRSIREKIIKIPIVSCNQTTSYGSALIAIASN